MKSEFEFINDLKSRYALGRIGDDCAVLPKDEKSDLLVTTDMLVEDIDFRLDWTTPEFLGHKALAVSLSDIAAMGGTPKWALTSIAIAEKLWKTDFLDRFYEGWHKLAQKYGLALVGGDVSKSSDKLVIDSIVCGEVQKGKSFLRSNAKAGDLIIIAGLLGGASGGLKLLEHGVKYDADTSECASALLLDQLKPKPQVDIANCLQLLDIRIAAIDISDGLSSDLAHICEASGVGARIDLNRLPVPPALPEHFEPDECREMALNGGEDLALLLAAPANEKDRLLELESICLIGEVTDRAGVVELVDGDQTARLFPRGFRHF